MKRLIFPLIIGVVFLSSCQKGPSYLLTDESVELKKLAPVCIVWYKPGKTAWEVNKSWVTPDNIDEMNRIKGLLTKADKVIVYTEGRHKLSLLFYDGYPENLKLWEVSFDLVGKRSFLGSVGASKELGELLSKYLPEERGPYFIRIDPNIVQEAQKRLQEESRKRIEEPNKPE